MRDQAPPRRLAARQAALLTLFLLAGATVATAQGPPYPAASGAACTLDLAPAATLLLPYFEVDTVRSTGRTTLLAVGNASEDIAVASVTLWTDLGVATVHFNVYLTGYDLQTINLRDVFAGTLPATGSVGQDIFDRVSPHGDFSQDINLHECDGLLPPPPMPGEVRSALLAAHTGGFVSSLGGCAGQAFPDGLARGYVTVDAVHTCTTRSPPDAGYFGAGGTGDARDANVLWGDFILVDPAGNTAIGEPLVRVQAFPGRFTSGQTTFYGRLLAHSAADDREPLATSWATRFAQRGAFSGGTELLVWRDPGRPSTVFACGGQPAWYPLYTAARPFDEQENFEQGGCPPVGCIATPQAIPFPAMTNRVSLLDTPLLSDGRGLPPVPTSFDFGWVYLGFADSDPHAQAWVAQLMSASGRFAVGLGATPLDSACTPSTFLPRGAAR
jgi:hypothetical protein